MGTMCTFIVLAAPFTYSIQDAHKHRIPVDPRCMGVQQETQSENKVSMWYLRLSKQGADSLKRTPFLFRPKLF